MRKNIVRWKDEEQQAVIKAAVDLRIMHPEPSLLTVVCMAQDQVLPENRRRALATIGAIPEVVAGVRDGLLESCTSSSPIVEVEVPRVEYRTEPGEVAARRLTLSELLVEGARRLAAGFEVGQLGKIISVPPAGFSFTATSAAAHPGEGAPEAQPVQAEKPQRVVVAVVGLLPNQQQEVLEKAKGLTNLEIVFAAKSQRPRIPTRVQYCIVQKHSGHRWYDKAQAQLGSRRVFFEPGGETGVLRKLADINSRVR